VVSHHKPLTSGVNLILIELTVVSRKPQKIGYNANDLIETLVAGFHLVSEFPEDEFSPL
jgi:hypothetical protein